MSKRLTRRAVVLAMAGCLAGCGATGLQNRRFGNPHAEHIISDVSDIARNTHTMIEPGMQGRKIHEENPTEPKKRNRIAELFYEFSIEVIKIRRGLE